MFARNHAKRTETNVQDPVTNAIKLAHKFLPVHKL